MLLFGTPVSQNIWNFCVKNVFIESVIFIIKNFAIFVISKEKGGRNFEGKSKLFATKMEALTRIEK
jgi:hypothetical protein